MIPAQPPARPAFVVHTATGTPMKGSLVQIDDKWSVIVEANGRQKVAGADLIAVRRADLPLPPPPAGPHLIFANGDRLRGSAGSLTGDRLSFAPAGGPAPALARPAELTLPFSALAVVWFDDPIDVERPDLLRRRLLAERRTRDVLWLRNGDVLQGTLLRLDAQALALEVEGKEVRVERTKLAYLALNNELVRTLRPKEIYSQLLLMDGSRLSLASVQSDGTTLQGRTLFGASIEVRVDQVAGLDIRQGRAVYLSDLKPASYEFTPFLPGLTFPWMADGSLADGTPAGDDLRLGGSTYVKGLGMHSGSRLTFALGDGYRRFEAQVGLDDRTGRQGRVVIGVVVDGKPRPWGHDKELSAGEGTKEVRVDVTGARELTLVVENGKTRPFVQGRVNWADARLIK